MQFPNVLLCVRVDQCRAIAVPPAAGIFFTSSITGGGATTGTTVSCSCDTGAGRMSQPASLPWFPFHE